MSGDVIAIEGPMLQRIRLECYEAALEAEAAAARIEAGTLRTIGKALNRADALAELVLSAARPCHRQDGSAFHIGPKDAAVIVSLASGFRNLRGIS